MEGKSKTIKLILIAIVAVAIIGIVVFLVTNKGDKKDKEEDTTNPTENVTDNDVKKQGNDAKFEVRKGEINVKESSKENELKLGEWGNASRKVTANFSYEEYRRIGYIEVPTSVTKVIRGKEAEDMVKKWYSTEKPNYTYDEPKEGIEWVVIEYKVDLSDVKIKEGSEGIDIALDCSLTGDKGGTSITYGKIGIILSPESMSDEIRAKEPGIYTGRIMAKLPVGFSDYTIQLGCSYDNTKEDKKGTIAYFKGE